VDAHPRGRCCGGQRDGMFAHADWGEDRQLVWGLDLGSAGYARATRGKFDLLPPFVVAPTYVTVDKELAWLDRAQCIGVGRVDMKALRAEYDVYVVSVGAAKHAE